MVHIVSILNLTHYETQVNRQQINIISKELTRSNEDIRALFNIANQLATQVQVQNIMLHLRAMLANLRDCLHFMKQLANHILEYIDTATTGTLIPHLIPVPDLQKMLYQIESELPLNMHLPIPSSDQLHFYRYLQTHVLVENQFLLLIDVPIQDRAQQIQIYKIINLPVPVGNYSIRYTMGNKYLGVTYDRTKAMDIPEDQFKLCKEANGQFCPLTTPLQPLTNPPSCVAALYTKNSQEIDRLCELTTKTQPELYLPIPLASNVLAIISSPFKQQPPVTVIYLTKPAMSIYICCALARPPAFLPTTPCVPSSLEGMWSRKAPNGYHSLNGANGLGQNPYSSCGFGLSQSEAFPPLSPEHSDVACECDIILPIKGKCMRVLKALLSGTWLLVLGLCIGD